MRIVFNFVWSAFYNLFAIPLVAGAFLKSRSSICWTGRDRQYSASYFYSVKFKAVQEESTTIIFIVVEFSFPTHPWYTY